MNGIRKLSFVAAAVLWIALFGLAGSPAAYAIGDADSNDSQPVPNKVVALSYVTWWSHDATQTGGYHPTILLKMENYSGKDLTGQLLRFQARFTDLTNGIVTVGRREVRQTLQPHKDIYVLLKGPQPFDLPAEDYRWPLIEVKVMCRVGDVGDEGTQSLIVSKLESITMNDDEAMERINRMTDFKTSSAVSNGRNGKSNASSGCRPARPEPPMVAHAERLQNGRTQLDTKKKPPPAPATAFAYISSKPMPGLGDDFYLFEKTFGLPADTNTSDQGWTWASYRHNDPVLTVLAGSKGQSGKVDVVILGSPESEFLKEAQLIEATHAFAGTLKSQKVNEPSHSVRYLPNGRMQMLTCTAPGYRSAYFSAAARTPDGNLGFLVLSRLPGNVLDLITDHGKRAALVQPLAQTLGGN